MQFPDEIRDLLKKHHEGGVSPDACVACSSGCCNQGGFAILENVFHIHQLYLAGRLTRKGYKFPKGLDLKEFIFRHFDVCGREVGPDGDKHELIFFHMKSIDEKGRLVSIPMSGSGSYWRVRGELFKRNPWLSRGCVFLSHPCLNWPRDDGYRKRHCILHTPDCDEILGPKPVDCLFYTCDEAFKAKIPTRKETDSWFHALARHFPNSQERFEELTGKKPVDPEAVELPAKAGDQ